MTSSSAIEDITTIYGNYISVYTRAQAIEDGVLIDVTKMANEAGIKYPVAVTQGLWSAYIVPDDRSKKYGQSENGRLWDTLWMFKKAAGRSKNESELHYQLYYIMKEKQKRLVSLKAIVHPGDNMEPVITIMLPHED